MRRPRLDLSWLLGVGALLGCSTDPAATAEGGGPALGGTDASLADGAPADGAPGDSQARDAGSDARTTRDARADSGPGRQPGTGAPCIGEGTACTFNDQAGLCVVGRCARCLEPSDDLLCTSAYGASGQSHICAAGSCTPGCRTSDGCPPGEICGIRGPGACGGCTDDVQCKGEARYGADSVCDPATHTCVPGSCASPNLPCNQNPGDMCCPVFGQAGSACVQGNCCTSDQCGVDQACVANACVPKTCSPVVASGSVTYHVDPSIGSDTAGTGTAACPLKTVARALALVGPSPAGQVEVVLHDTTDTAPTERFPWILPAGVSIQTSRTANPGVAYRSVFVPSEQLGIWVRKANSNIRGLRLVGDNAASRAALGIAVTGGGARVDGVTIRGFSTGGLSVTAGAVDVKGLDIDHRQGGANTAAVAISGGAVRVEPWQYGRPLRVLGPFPNPNVPVSCIQIRGGTFTLLASGSNYSRINVSGGTVGLDVRGGNVLLEAETHSDFENSVDNVVVSGGSFTARGSLLLGNSEHGLYVRGGAAEVAPTGTDSVSAGPGRPFKGYAIRVDGNEGPVKLTGQRTVSGISNFLVSSGSRAAIFINQSIDPNALPPPLVSLTEISGNGAGGAIQGDALLVTAGSNVRVRKSDFRNLRGNAVHIVAPSNPAKSLSLQNIDLGSDLAAEAGANVFQARTGAGGGPREVGVNDGAGICLEIPPDKGEQLRALGNFFSTVANDRQVDCLATEEEIAQKTACTGPSPVRTSLGGEGLLDRDGNFGNNNRVDVSRCTVVTVP